MRSGTTDEWRQEITGKDLAFVNKAMVDNMPKVMIDEFFSAEDKLSMKH